MSAPREEFEAALELALQLRFRSLMYPSEEMHNAAIEAQRKVAVLYATAIERAESAEAQARERAVSEGMAIDANDTWRDMVREMRAERDASRAALAEAIEALKAEEWAQQYKGSPVGDTPSSRHSSEEAIRRANAELSIKARELRRKALTAHAPEPDARTTSAP